ncbi:copper chaperone PCu(A)C [Aestuariirhabdus litorea]|uniref:Copper chaperone PCu(A)C n=1 Tax=Aestuariirhabdus litorea TaxID=2528527 RepID=A0A3P3VP27_9GAMM|nr:copper chaperone PCu(A)C [Aestuariirhabdus litorea]RRJ83678.1 copper chaperone PCu(A)C [Aestuariirhabdus litorea]RWW96900.1 copper chaperone PCu(A)C [Endozoicomonadaceae bacterium GTF-13]
MRLHRFILTLLCGLSLSATVSASEELIISEGWVRVTPPGATNSAAYMTITNRSDTPLTLVAARTSTASMTQLHQSKMEMGMMKMEQQAEGIKLAAQSTLELKPGGYHVMLMGVTSPLNEGDQVMLVLEFSDGALRELLLPVLSQSPGQLPAATMTH